MIQFGGIYWIFIYGLAGVASQDRGFINSPTDLNCDFDQQCRWRNGTNCTEDEIDWFVGDSVVLDHWHSIPRGKNGPGDLFAYARGLSDMRHGDKRALLISDPIQCQKGNGMLSFLYWKTALGPMLRVCIRKYLKPSAHITCMGVILGLHRQEWSMQTVIIHQQNEPFEILIEASKLHHNFDIVGLDKITYSGQICPAESEEGQTNPTQLTFPPPTITFPVTDENGQTEPVTRSTGSFSSSGGVTFEPQTTSVFQDGSGLCSAVQCNFDEGNPCRYTSGQGSPEGPLPAGSGFRSWRVTNAATSNSLTGIFSDVSGSKGPNISTWCSMRFRAGGYAYAGETTNNLDTFVLATPRFTVTSSNLVEFNYYLAGVRGRLRVCVNGLIDCRFESSGKDIKSDARNWRVGTVLLHPGSYTLNFVADNMDKNYVIGLDNIKVKSSDGTAIVCA